MHMQANAPETVFRALDDDNVDVRRNVYETLANASTIGPGERGEEGGGGGGTAHRHWLNPFGTGTRVRVCGIHPENRLVRHTLAS